MRGENGALGGHNMIPFSARNSFGISLHFCSVGLYLDSMHFLITDFPGSPERDLIDQIEAERGRRFFARVYPIVPGEMRPPVCNRLPARAVDKVLLDHAPVALKDKVYIRHFYEEL